MLSLLFRRLPAATYFVATLGALLVASVSAGASPPSQVGVKPAQSSLPISADDVIHLILRRNPTLRSYTAHVHVDIRQLNFPYLHPAIDGTTYYKSPGLVVSTFSHVPFYLKSVNLQQSGAYAASKFKLCYAVAVSDDGDAYHLYMLPYLHSRVKSLDVIVGKSDGAIRHMEWRYLQNSRDHITLDLHYSDVEGYNIVTSEVADIRVDHIRAMGLTLFTNFLFNVPVPTPTPNGPDRPPCSNLD